MPVYFIQAGEGGPVKIGFTDHIGRRISKMQSDNHERLRVIALYEGDQGAEVRIHEQLAAFRLRGEWFSPVENVLSYGCDLRPLAFPAPAVDMPVWRKGVSVQAYFAQRGAQRLAASALGLNPAAVCQWHRVPARHVAALSAATGMPVATMRPDLFRLFWSDEQMERVTGISASELRPELRKGPRRLATASAA